MVFLGYHPTGAYKLYDQRLNRIVISKDVKVGETKSWNWETSAVMINNEKSVVVSLDGNPDDQSCDATVMETRRPQRSRQPPQRLQDYAMFSDTAVNDEGNLVCYALFS